MRLQQLRLWKCQILFIYFFLSLYFPNILLLVSCNRFWSPSPLPWLLSMFYSSFDLCYNQDSVGEGDNVRPILPNDERWSPLCLIAIFRRFFLSETRMRFDQSCYLTMAAAVNEYSVFFIDIYNIWLTLREQYWIEEGKYHRKVSGQLLDFIRNELT